MLEIYDFMDKLKKEESDGNKSKFPVIAVAIVSILLIIILIFAAFIFIAYGSSPKQETLFSSAAIESAFLNNDLNSLYLKIKNENLTASLTNATVKFILRNLNGTEYVYKTNKTVSEITSDELSIPLKKGILDFFAKSNYAYDYKLNLSDIKGLDNFKSISNIEIAFEPKTLPVSNLSSSQNNTAQNTTSKKRTTVTTTDSNDNTNTPTTSTNNCTNSPWTNETFRCSSRAREAKQTRTLCATGNTEERWGSVPCDAGYVCYDGLGAPSEKCINQTFYCTDSDNGINSTLNTSVNISQGIFNDLCLDNRNLTEYYCFHTNTGFEARNQTINCASGCENGACITCIDNDNDNYSLTRGVCGQIDCNDSDADINPGKEEICGNDIDENCDGNADGCESFGLSAYYRFNDDLSDEIVFDETGINNASCSGFCPAYKENLGLNSSAYEFNGNSNYLVIPNNVLNNNTFSVSAWIKPNSSGSDGMIIYSNAGSITTGIISLWYSRATNSIFIYNNYGLENQSMMDTISPNEWSNIVLTYNYPTRQAKIYINGELKISDSDFSQTPPINITMIGAKSDNSKYFYGYMDEIKIYNRILSDSEIQSIYNNSGQLPSMGFFERFWKWVKGLFLI